MSLANRFIYRLKRSDSPVLKSLKKLVLAIYRPVVPPLPRKLIAPLRAVYELHYFTIVVVRSLITVLYRNPLFQARCASFGRRVSLEGLPFVSGHVEIHVGDGVTLGGKINVLSGGIFEQPRLILKDRASVGWGTTFTVNKEIIVEEDAIISYDCRISDSDGHRRESDLRAAGVPPDPKDVRPVRICRYAFVGNGSHIMKGVTIGEGAIIGAKIAITTFSKMIITPSIAARLCSSR